MPICAALRRLRQEAHHEFKDRLQRGLDGERGQGLAGARWFWDAGESSPAVTGRETGGRPSEGSGPQQRRRQQQQQQRQGGDPRVPGAAPRFSAWRPRALCTWAGRAQGQGASVGRVTGEAGQGPGGVQRGRDLARGARARPAGSFGGARDRNTGGPGQGPGLVLLGKQGGGGQNPRDCRASGTGSRRGRGGGLFRC